MGVFRPLQFNKAICFVIKVRCTWSALSLSVSICVNKSTCSVQFHTDIIPFWGNLYPHVLLTCDTHNAFPCTFLKTETWPIPLKQTSHSCFRCYCFMWVLGHLSISLLFAETSHITCRLHITYKPLHYLFNQENSSFSYFNYIFSWARLFLWTYIDFQILRTGWPLWRTVWNMSGLSSSTLSKI